MATCGEVFTNIKGKWWPKYVSKTIILPKPVGGQNPAHDHKSVAGPSKYLGSTYQKVINAGIQNLVYEGFLVCLQFPPINKG